MSAVKKLQNVTAKLAAVQKELREEKIERAQEVASLNAEITAEKDQKDEARNFIALQTECIGRAVSTNKFRQFIICHKKADVVQVKDNFRPYSERLQQGLKKQSEEFQLRQNQLSDMQKKNFSHELQDLQTKCRHLSFLLKMDDVNQMVRYMQNNHRTFTNEVVKEAMGFGLLVFRHIVDMLVSSSQPGNNSFHPKLKPTEIDIYANNCDTIFSQLNLGPGVEQSEFVAAKEFLCGKRLVEQIKQEQNCPPTQAYPKSPLRSNNRIKTKEILAKLGRTEKEVPTDMSFMSPSMSQRSRMPPRHTGPSSRSGALRGSRTKNGAKRPANDCTTPYDGNMGAIIQHARGRPDSGSHRGRTKKRFKSTPPPPFKMEEQLAATGSGGGGAVVNKAPTDDSGGTAQTFQVTIPPNSYPGMQFTVVVSGQHFVVTCPAAENGGGAGAK